MSSEDNIENYDNNDSQGSMTTQCGSQIDQLDSVKEEKAASTSSGSPTGRKRRADCLKANCTLHGQCTSHICNVSVLDGLKARKLIKTAIEEALEQNKIVVILPALGNKNIHADEGDSS